MPTRPPVHRPVHSKPRAAAEKQRKALIDDRRGSAAARGYDASWRRVRGAFLKAHPLCECDDCQAGLLRTRPAEVVDHRIPIVEAPHLRLTWSNLRAMAKACHDRRTAIDQGFARGRPGVGRPG